MEQNPTVVFYSDFDFAGSGYFNISTHLCAGLAEKGYVVKCVGLNYHGEEHSYPFSIIPASNLEEAYAVFNNLCILRKPEIVITAMDIPLQIMVLQRTGAIKQQVKFKHIGITALENGPLVETWALALSRLDYTLFISELGKTEARKTGMPKVDHIPVGIDTNLWKPLSEEDRKLARKNLGYADDDFIVLTVADNQERKNLLASFKAVKLALEKTDLKHILVTREQNPYGWNLRDLARTLGISDKVFIYERGMSSEQLRLVYGISNVFLILSKGEGLCVLPESKVWTQGGLVEIKDIEIGNKVVTDDGELNLVTDIFSRDINENVNFVKMGFGLDEISATNGHKVLSSKRYGQKINGYVPTEIEWIDVEKLKKGDFVFFPKIKSRDTEKVFISDYVGDVTVSGDGRVHSIGRNQFGSSFVYSLSRQKYVKNSVDVDRDFCSLIGWYVSEGCESDGLNFSLHCNETEYQNTIKRILKDKFGLSVTERFLDRNRYSCIAYSTIVGKFFSAMCGDEAHNKHLPSWMLYASEEKLWSVLEALFSGDGSYDPKTACLRYSTVSSILAQQIQFILFRLGVVSSARSCNGRTEHTVSIHRPYIFKVPFIKDPIRAPKKEQSQIIESDNGYLVPIRKVEKRKYSGKVINLEVSNRQNYLLSGGIVHNCMPILEAQACGIPVIATDTGAIHELLEDERGWLVNPEYTLDYDTWGNAKRDFASPSIAAGMILAAKASKHDCKDIALLARKYATTRTWNKSVEKLTEIIEELFDGKKEAE